MSAIQETDIFIFVDRVESFPKSRSLFLIREKGSAKVSCTVLTLVCCVETCSNGFFFSFVFRDMYELTPGFLKGPESPEVSALVFGVSFSYWPVEGVKQRKHLLGENLFQFKIKMEF